MSLLLLLRGAVAASTRSLTLDSNPAVPARGDLVTITATLLDENGDPLVAKTIYFAVAGANPGSGSDTTDVNGEVAFQYTATNAGTDRVRARWGKATGIHLLSTDNSTDMIYEHDGFSATILDSFASGNTSTGHLAFDGENVLTRDGQIVQKLDFNGNLLDSFDAGDIVLGLAHDGTNVLAAFSPNVVKRFDGFSSTVLEAITLSGVTINAIGWDFDGENLLVVNGVNLAPDEARRYDGFSTTLLDTVTLPFDKPTNGIALDGDDLIVGADELIGSGPSPIYRYVGFSTTLGEQIFSPSSQLSGVTLTIGLADILELDIAIRGRGLVGSVAGRMVP